MVEKIIEVKYSQYKSLAELSADDAFLVTKAREASLNAWAPYSNFCVGAAVQLDNGEIVIGSNQENAAYPSGLCAERVALFYANAKYPNSSVLSIAISACNSKGLVSEPIKPCGSCRQAILESEIRFEHSIRTILDGQSEVIVIEGVKNLLPLSFGKNDLE